MESAEDKAGGNLDAANFQFPQFIVCHSCGVKRRVNRREICEMPEGVAGVAWANCGRCHHTFVRFIGEKKPAARLMQMWLGLQEK
ncbi:MAG: hypothetical protein A3F74_00370 [Betaproteobacteria bacterium RIFCSPLOWO2_12_FULL_62_58]|nr:MAG: hypothetical protein A3F74_00370 [Betaproteobacteria bacterium RIFCSPLOWO2_12_FULL_62_58]